MADAASARPAATPTDAEIFARIVTLRTQPRRGGYAPLISLIASAVLFVGLGVLPWDLSFVVHFLIAVFVHELGHVIAMRAFAYRDVRMMFIPLVGGMAAGDPDDLDALKIAVISLAGPAVGLGRITGWTEFATFAWVSVALNAFNLLPLVPLDGGHSLDEVLLSRRPRARLIVRSVALAVLAVVVVAIGLYGLLIVLAWSAWRIPADDCRARAIERLRADPHLAGGALTPEKISRIRAALRAGPAGPEPADAVLAREVWDTWLQVKKILPTRRQIGQLLVVQAGLLLGVVPALVLLLRAWTSP